MQFRFLKEKITPDIPVLQMGFASRDHKSLGVHDDPYVSVVLLRANETVVIIALDVVYGDRSFAGGIKQAIQERFGLAQDQIIISYTHTHSTVAVTGEDSALRKKHTYHMAADKFAWDLEDEAEDFTEDIRYFQMIRSKILSMIEEGINNPIEGDIHIAKGHSDFGISRRYPADGKILWKPNPDKNCMDPDLYLLKFTDREGALRGLIYSYACHPTTLGPDNYYISADYPGIVRRILEERHPGLVPVFLQGCGADIKPYITADNGRFKSCNFAELEQASQSLAADIENCLDQANWRKIEASLATGFFEVKLYTEIWDAAQWERILSDPNQPDYRKKSIRQTLQARQGEPVKDHLPYYLSYLRLDGQTCLICLECEVVSDIGKEIKNLFREDVITLGYTNSSACYIPTRKVLQDGGYERESFMSAHLAGPFVPEVEDIVVGRAALLVSDVK